MIKKGNKKMPTPRQKVIHNPIHTLHLCFLTHFMKAFGYRYVLCFFVLFSAYTKRQQQNKDVGMGKYEHVSAGMVKM